MRASAALPVVPRIVTSGAHPVRHRPLPGRRNRIAHRWRRRLGVGERRTRRLWHGRLRRRDVRRRRRRRLGRFRWRRRSGIRWDGEQTAHVGQRNARAVQRLQMHEGFLRGSTNCSVSLQHDPSMHRDAGVKGLFHKFAALECASAAQPAFRQLAILNPRRRGPPCTSPRPRNATTCNCPTRPSRAIADAAVQARESAPAR